MLPYVPEYENTEKLLSESVYVLESIESTLEIELEPELKNYLLNSMQEMKNGTLKTYTHKEVFGK